MASKVEAKQLAGELLGIVPIGQAMQSQHNVKMGEAYDEVHAELETLNLPVWATTEEMPDEITPHFIGLMAFNKMDLYGISDSRYQRILLKVGPEGDTAKDAIRLLMSAAYSSTDAPTDY